MENKMTFAEGIAKVKAMWPDRYFTIETSYSQIRSGVSRISFCGRVGKAGDEGGFDRYCAGAETFAQCVAALLTPDESPELAEAIIDGSAIEVVA